MELIDISNGDFLQIGDTNYGGYGFYLYGAGAAFNGTGSQTELMFTMGNSLASFMDYRITIDGRYMTIERSASLADPSQVVVTQNMTLPQSIVGRTFYLRIGTGANDLYYSPGTFDSVSVTVTP